MRGHRGKRPRGDGSRGPRTSSCTGRPQSQRASLLGAAILCAPLCCSFGIFLLPLLAASQLALQTLSVWTAPPWLNNIAFFGAAAVFVMAFFPSISFTLHRLRQLIHHTAALLFVAIHLLLPPCMAASVPTPTPTPPPTPTPTPTPPPTPDPLLQLQSSTVSSSAPWLPSTFIISGAFVLLALATRLEIRGIPDMATNVMCMCHR